VAYDESTMTIDERLKKLTERTDAIARKIEFIVSLRRDRLRDEEACVRNEGRFAKIDESILQLMNIMNHLTELSDGR
jgi:hypothetical protein